MDDPYGHSREPIDTVRIIADALRIKFGSKARAVAEFQRDAANSDTPATWDEIVALLMREADRRG